MADFLQAFTTWTNSGTARTVYVKHKAVHAIAGLLIYLALFHVIIPALALAVVFTVGVSKEVFDKNNGGSFRVGDIAWTCSLAFLLCLARF